MKRAYLALTVIGFILPNIFVFKESVQSGNILFYARPLETFELMFINNVSSAFMVDLLFVVALFLFWSYREARKYQIKNIWLIWICTFAFGIASGLPLFLYLREIKYKNVEVGVSSGC